MNTIKVFDSKNNDSDVKLLFGGDFCPIRQIEQKMLNGKKIFDNNLLTLFKNSDQFIVNFEAPLCDNLKPQGASGLRASKTIAPIVKELGIDIAGLANNHLRDFGDEGVMQTINALEQAGIECTGAGANINKAQKMKIIKLKGLKIGLWMLAEKELNVASESRPGTSLFQPEKNIYEIPALRKQVDFLIIVVHSGHEFILTPSPRIRDSYRQFISTGADAVIGHHPHVPQGFEQWENGWIFYSLGNLLFDSQYVFSHKNTRTGYLVSLTVNKHHTNQAEIIPYHLNENYTVTSFENQQINSFKNTITELNHNIADNKHFMQEWHNNVKSRWEEDYKKIVLEIPKKLTDPKDKHFSLWAQNFFSCPTHHEFMETVMKLIHSNKIQR